MTTARDPLAAAAAVVKDLNARWPNTARLYDLEAEPTVYALLTRADLAEADALVTSHRATAATSDLCTRQYTADGFLVEIGYTVEWAVAMRVLAGVLLELDDRTGGILMAILAGHAGIPADADAATPWHRVTPDDDGTLGVPEAFVLAWVEQHYASLPFASPVPLDSAGEILATLLEDLAKEHGLGSFDGYLTDSVDDILDAVTDRHAGGQDPLATARALAVTRAPVQVAKSRTHAAPGRQA